MLIVDADLDLSWNALQWGRDLRRSVYTIHTQENVSVERGRRLGTVAFPEMRQGRVALCFATLLARATGQPAPHVDYATPRSPTASRAGSWRSTARSSRTATSG